MKLQLLLLVVVAVLVAVSAHDEEMIKKAIKNFKMPLFGMKIGRCPQLDPVEGYDMSKLAGRWYEVFRSPSVFSFGVKCTRVDAELQADNTMKVEAQTYVKRLHKFLKFCEKWWIPNGAPSGTILVDFHTPIFGGVFKIQSVAFQADKYHVGYGCFEGAEGLVHYDFVSVASRTPQLLCPKARAEIKEKLQHQGIDITQMLPTNQFECPREEDAAFDHEWKFPDTSDILSYYRRPHVHEE